MVARTILQQQDEQDQRKLETLLGPVVQFMQALARPHSALAFLREGNSNTLRLNSHFSQAINLIPDAVIRDGEGLLGRYLHRENALVTGDSSAFGCSPEYYHEVSGSDSERCHITSMIALPVFLDGQNPATDIPEALLVMDNNNSSKRFSDDMIAGMRIFAKVTSALITSERSRAEMIHQQMVQSVVFNVQNQLSRHLKAEQILPILVNELQKIFDFRRIVFCTWSPARKRGNIAYVAGSPDGLSIGTGFRFEENGLYASVFRQQKPKFVTSLRERGLLLYDQETDAAQQWLPLDVLAVPLMNDEGHTVAVLGMETDESGVCNEKDLQLLSSVAGIASIALQKARMYAEMERLATIDGLTGIPNHRHFQNLLSEKIDYFKRYSGKIGFLLFDIDHFKIFNDTYGHAIGDLVLRSVAQCVAHCSRTTDIVARYGGEEFVVVLPNTDLQTAYQSAERIRAAIEAMEIPHETQGILKVTVSIGVSIYPDQASAKQQLIDNADKAMYLSKCNGRNRVSIYGPEAEALAQEKEK